MFVQCIQTVTNNCFKQKYMHPTTSERQHRIAKINLFKRENILILELPKQNKIVFKQKHVHTKPCKIHQLLRQDK